MGAPSPAGWYPDPSGLGQRYHDGQQWTEHRSPTLTESQRTTILQQELVRATSRGGRVVTQSPTSALGSVGGDTNHVVHVLLAIFTCGFWLIIWLLAASSGDYTTTRLERFHGLTGR